MSAFWSCALAAPAYDVFDRHLLGVEQASGRTQVWIVAVARAGEAGTLVKAIEAAGGSVRFKADDVDYVRARVPIAGISKIARSASVQTLTVDAEPFFGGLPPSRGVDLSGLAEERKTPAWLAEAPVDSPLAPIVSLGLPQFWKSHPTFDGRGTTLAIVERLPDLTLPEFAAALSIDGARLPKLAGAIYVRDGEAGLAPGRIEMMRNLRAADGHLSIEGADYLTGAAGLLDFGRLDERHFSGYGYAGDIDRDGNPQGSSPLFAVIREHDSGCIRVDVDRDRDLAEEPCLQDFRRSGRYGRFRAHRDERWNPPFALFEEDDGALTVLLPSPHTTWITAVATGADFLGSKLSGAAPAAQLVPVMIGHRIASIAEGLIAAGRDPRIDIVVMVTSLGHLPNDGRSVVAAVASRLALKYDKLMFLMAGNDRKSLNSVDEYAAGEGVVSVGNYASAATLSALFGRQSACAHHSYNSGAGPAANGSIKPDIVSPGHSITVNPLYHAPFPNITQYPDFPRDAMAGEGTSFATPNAAGMAAVLLSAARQKGLSIKRSDIRRALLASAKYLDCVPAHQQGRGLPDAAAAWELLQALPPALEFDVTPVVKTAASGLLQPLAANGGLYEREGWTAGRRGVRTLSIVRRSGAADASRFKLRLRGDDARTFSVKDEVTLEVGRPTQVPIAIAPQSNGVHSALLEIVDPASGRSVREIGLTVVAAAQLTADRQFTAVVEDVMDLAAGEQYYFAVPPGTTAFHVEADPQRDTGGVAVQIRFGNPLGYPQYSAAFAEPLEPDGNARMSQQVVRDPLPGVWEVSVSGYRFAAGDPRTKMRIRAQAFVLGATPPRDPVLRLVKGLRLQQRVRVADGMPALVPMEVPFEARRISLSVRKRPDAAKASSGITTLRLMACVSAGCETLESTSGADRASLILPAPPAGRLVLAVDHEAPDGAAAEFSVEGTIVRTEEFVGADWRCANDGPAAGCPTRPACQSDAQEYSALELVDLSIGDVRWLQWFDRTAHAVVTPIDLAVQPLRSCAP